jgi:hypothetical protein
MKTVEKLANKIYKEEGINGIGMSRVFISEYLDKIKFLNPLEKQEFIVFNLSKFPHNYNLLLLASTNELWENFNYSDWKNIIESVNREKSFKELNSLKDIDFVTGIIFISKFLEVNPFEFIERSERLKNKKSLIDYIEKMNVFFQLTEEDKEDMQEGLIASKDSFQQAKERIKKTSFLLKENY